MVMMCLLSSALPYPKLTMTLVMPLASVLLFTNTMNSQEVIAPLWYYDQFSSSFSMISTWLNSLTPLTFGPTLPLTLATTGSLLFYSSHTWLLLFITFEASMLPIYYLLQSVGQQPERMRAARLMLLYTTVSSAPLLMMVMSQSHYGTMHFPTLNLPDNFQPYPLLFLLAFMVKAPLYTTHSWLPLAHVESPLIGSIFLAGVLLKFGTVGLYRSLPLFPTLYRSDLAWVLVAIATLGAIYSACSCWVVTDLKVVVAYASVSHMNVSLASLILCKLTALNGAYLSAVSHSFCSSLLFLLVVTSSKLTNSRNHYANLGVLSAYPILSMSNLLTWAMNMNIPPNVSFLGEMEYLQTFSNLSNLSTVLLLTYMFLSSLYSMSVYGTMSHGPYKVKLKSNLTSSSFLLSMVYLILPPVAIFSFPYQLEI